MSNRKFRKQDQNIELNDSKNSGQIGIAGRDLVQVLVKKLNIFHTDQRFKPPVVLLIFLSSVVSTALSVYIFGVSSPDAATSPFFGVSSTNTTMSKESMLISMPLAACIFGFIPWLGEIGVLVYAFLSCVTFIHPASFFSIFGAFTGIITGVKLRKSLF